MALLTSGQLAKELGVTRAAVNKWAQEGKITPEVTTPGGHHRWVLDDVKRQLREMQRRGG
ncbi:hypothetical protein GCM10009609_44480 [Pseudonocardia aurantiaca]|uniref:MerR family DNA-binding transcriptional regulator n=1 Tax=Pseudonocardia aurantiaca TaxID=75290 RepID=A0ABW4FG26_9PSEU